jgi:hypothetical protein
LLDLLLSTLRAFVRRVDRDDLRGTVRDQTYKARDSDAYQGHGKPVDRRGPSFRASNFGRLHRDFAIIYPLLE